MARSDTKFENYFSAKTIIQELCRARVKLADHRNEALFFHDIDRSQRSAEEILATDWGEIATDIFPARKLWSRYRRRSGYDNLETLVCAVRCLSQETPQAGWAKRLRDTVEAIRYRALSQAPFVFAPPGIRPEVKNPSKHTYRPVASFGLSDKIIDCLTSRYFRETLDSALLECCLAFRPRKYGRNDGLDIILQKKQIHSRLFVAECDIQGFFDCVSHAVARETLTTLIADAQRRDSSFNKSPRALEIFDAYLSCYSFLRNVRQCAELELKKGHQDAQYPWPEEELRLLHETSRLERIGVPQGGALSGVIANALPHSADKEMRSFCKERSVTYLRYCDDMILLAPERAAAVAAFERYCAAVKRLKLPIHCPQELVPYKGSHKQTFWSAKSRAVYKWADPIEVDAYPWIQFLGYQIRYDGSVRVRPSSINKELSKLTRITGRLLGSLQPSNMSNIRRSPRSIVHSFRMKVISMGVGRRKCGQPLTGPLPKCWANGFRWLSGKNVITSNLRALDSQRERQINRVVRKLHKLELPDVQSKPKRKHYGFPFSYIGQFLRLGSSSDAR